MFKFRLHNEQNTEQTVDKKALIFGLMSVFLCGIGFTIIAPVVPFLVQPYKQSGRSSYRLLRCLPLFMQSTCFLRLLDLEL